MEEFKIDSKKPTYMIYESIEKQINELNNKIEELKKIIEKSQTEETEKEDTDYGL